MDDLEWKKAIPLTFNFDKECDVYLGEAIAKPLRVKKNFDAEGGNPPVVVVKVVNEYVSTLNEHCEREGLPIECEDIFERFVMNVRSSIFLCVRLIQELAALGDPTAIKLRHVLRQINEGDVKHPDDMKDEE